MHVKFAKAWGIYGPGDEADLDPPIVEILVDRGVAQRTADRETACTERVVQRTQVRHKPERRKIR